MTRVRRRNGPISHGLSLCQQEAYLEPSLPLLPIFLHEFTAATNISGSNTFSNAGYSPRQVCGSLSDNCEPGSWNAAADLAPVERNTSSLSIHRSLLLLYYFHVEFHIAEGVSISKLMSGWQRAPLFVLTAPVEIFHGDKIMWLCRRDILFRWGWG